MRSFAIPSATLSLTLATACGPGLTPLGSYDGEDTSGDWPPDDTDTNTPPDTDPPDTDPPDTDTGPPDTDTGPPDTDTNTDPGAAIAGSWQGTLLENVNGSTALPYTYSGIYYTQYISTSLSLSPQITGTMQFRNEVLYFGIPYDYSSTYACSGGSLGGSSYSITMQSTSATLQMQCAHQGSTLDCMSSGADPLRLVFTR